MSCLLRQYWVVKQASLNKYLPDVDPAMMDAVVGEYAPGGKLRKGKLISEIAGGFVPGLMISGGLGAMGYASGNKGEKMSRFVKGAGAGSLISTMITLAAAGAALGTPTETDAQRRVEETRHPLLNFIVPGRASYKLWKRVGKLREANSRNQFMQSPELQALRQHV